MDNLLGVPEIMARYKCCRQTASRIIRQMRHITEPRLMAPEWAVEDWERMQMMPKRSAEICKIPRRRA